jgi:hypothetical protein
VLIANFDRTILPCLKIFASDGNYRWLCCLFSSYKYSPALALEYTSTHQHGDACEIECSKSCEFDKAGDPIPTFTDNMIRQYVDRDGKLHSIAPASELRGCRLPNSEIGWSKEAALAA